MTTPAEHDPDALNDALIGKLKAEGALHSPDTERAFRRVHRHHFLPGLDAQAVYRDEAIATHRRESDEWISSSSQPAMMAIMLEQLQLGRGMHVLEIGAGTGYNAALLAALTGDAWNVWTVDMDEEFCAEARAHLEAAGAGGVRVLCADGWQGWPDAAPYDRIIVTASAYDIAPAWFGQLREGGVMVVPWGAPFQQRCLGFRKQNGRLIQQATHACGFMKMRGRHEWTDQPPPEAEDAWERPWSVSPPPIAGTALDDLAFFLSLFLWPLIPTIFWMGEPSDDTAKRLGLMDRTRRILATVEMEERWKTVGSGDRKKAEDLEEYAALWQQWGRPTPEQVRLTAYPRGTAPVADGDVGLARREWFDYVVSVGD
ncbi:MAG: methyltransferase domain-containing protein [Armatimonadetes bacterium]|nr:methyltransferase domain-containing protein [Armatimonadota bacterium]